MTCTKCGAQFEGRYCPACGAAAERQSVPPPLMAPAQPGVPSNWAGVICYVVPIIGPLVFLFLAPYNTETRVRFNAWQALFLQLAYFAFHLVISAFGDIAWRMTLLLTRLVDLAYLAVIIFMAIKAYQNEKFVIPYIGPIADRQK